MSRGNNGPENLNGLWMLCGIILLLAVVIGHSGVIYDAPNVKIQTEKAE